MTCNLLFSGAPELTRQLQNPRHRTDCEMSVRLPFPMKQKALLGQPAVIRKTTLLQHDISGTEPNLQYVCFLLARHPCNRPHAGQPPWTRGPDSLTCLEEPVATSRSVALAAFFSRRSDTRSRRSPFGITTCATGAFRYDLGKCSAGRRCLIQVSMPQKEEEAVPPAPLARKSP